MHSTTRRLLDWYQTHGRDLPWRRDPTPYHTWLSEIMLQQTRVETVIPYYERFLVRFPTVEQLAAAPLDEVLGLWAGLGYYRRARNLHAAAAQVAALGAFPASEAGLRALAGVGDYTAAAIASIAFGCDAVAVDGNLRRVVARLAAIELSVQAGPGAARVRRWLEDKLPSGRAGDFNQALMDIGATVCSPRAPRCSACPLASDCQAHGQGLAELLPVTAPRAAPRPVQAVALLVVRDGALLLSQRPAQGLLAGLWGPPDRVVAEGETTQAALDALKAGIPGLAGGAVEPAGQVEHVFSHQRWCVQVSILTAQEAWSEPPACRWWRPAQADGPPLSRLAEKLLERNF